MKKILIVLALTSQVALADFLTLEGGASCTIPDRYNAAPYDEIYNRKGMSDFCVFPQRKWDKAFFDMIENLKRNGLIHPICNDGELVLSPTIPIRPCYKLLTD